MNTNNEQKGNSGPTSQRCSCGTKTKLTLACLLILAIAATLATVAVCAAILSIRSSGSLSSTDTEIDSLERKADMLNDLVRTERSQQASIQRRQNGQRSRDKSCYSLQTNDSYPAAHITGTMPRWDDKDSEGYGYNSHWICKRSGGAFVDGGMYFNQTDKKLYVPKCGYYYISSQMYFSYTPEENQQFVRHLLKVDRNCGERSTLDLESISSLGQIGKRSQTSTYMADIVKICSGGKISVIVPANYQDTNPCCPGGQNTVTFLSAHLVRETDCEWNDRRILDHPPTQQDYNDYYSGH